MPYTVVDGQQQSSFLPHTAGDPVFNQYSPQAQAHWYAPPGSSSVWPASSSQRQLQSHRRQYSPDYSPRLSSQTIPNIQLSADPDVNPPRRPRQSGYALWVGNVPQNTRLQELTDFFAMDGIESVFLIRKSNCAFVNYNTQKTCEEALAAFHLKGGAILPV
jgi:hypothetical protein